LTWRGKALERLVIYGSKDFDDRTEDGWAYKPKQ
jgi:hypothetical protein